MTTIDFSDEDAVLAEVAKDLDIDPERASISEDRGLCGFRAGIFYRIEVGNKEYIVAEDTYSAEQLAIAIVTDDLENEPELFNKDFLRQHIDIDRLRRDLLSDVQDMIQEDLQYDADRNVDNFWRAVEDYIEVPEPDEEGNLREPDSLEVEKAAEKMAEDRLRDPIEYLEEIYGDEATAKAVEIAGIDIRDAAEAAVREDGWEHFVARYDGRSHEIDSGLVYWREN